VSAENSALLAEQQVADRIEVATPAAGDMGAFFGTLAAMLKEATVRFEKTTDRVSDLVVAHTGRAGPDLIVALQDFDRLQQEFSAVCEVLSRMEKNANGPWPGHLDIGDLKHELLKTVTIADFKRRLSLHFEMPERVIVPGDDDLVAEF